MWTDNIVWSWYETDKTVPDDKWLKISCYIMSVSKIKTCARECKKNAYQHENIYILESNQRNYEQVKNNWYEQ